MGKSPTVQTPAPPPAPPAPPSFDEATLKTRQEAEDFRKRKGTQSNIQSSGDGPITMAAKLLGS